MRKLMVSINVIKKYEKIQIYTRMQSIKQFIMKMYPLNDIWSLGFQPKGKGFQVMLFQDQKFFYNLSSKNQQIYSIVFLVLSTFKKILSQKTTGAVWKKNIMEKIKFNKYIRDIKILYNIYFTGLFCRLLTNRQLKHTVVH